MHDMPSDGKLKAETNGAHPVDNVLPREPGVHKLDSVPIPRNRYKGGKQHAMELGPQPNNLSTSIA